MKAVPRHHQVSLFASTLSLLFFTHKFNHLVISTMDEEMQDVTLPCPSASRKRTANDVDDDDEEDTNYETTPTETPSKRLRNPHGDAVQRTKLHFNAHELLNNLAFTRLYVTGNYDHYSATQSPVLICVLSRHDALYRAVW